MLTSGDVTAGQPDGLVVAAHGFARPDVVSGQFVARRNQVAHAQLFGVDQRIGQQLLTGNQHVVVGVQADGQRRVHWEWLSDKGEFVHGGLDADALNTGQCLPGLCDEISQARQIFAP